MFTLDHSDLNFVNFIQLYNELSNIYKKIVFIKSVLIIRKSLSSMNGRVV